MQSHKLSSRPWERIRRAVLQRDGYTCSRCRGFRKLEVHHIEPRHLAPEKKYDLDNLKILCRFCHEDLHNKEQIPADAYAWRQYMENGVN